MIANSTFGHVTVNLPAQHHDCFPILQQMCRMLASAHSVAGAQESEFATQRKNGLPIQEPFRSFYRTIKNAFEDDTCQWFVEYLENNPLILRNLFVVVAQEVHHIPESFWESTVDPGVIAKKRGEVMASIIQALMRGSERYDSEIFAVLNHLWGTHARSICYSFFQYFFHPESYPVAIPDPENPNWCPLVFENADDLFEHIFRTICPPPPPPPPPEFDSITSEFDEFFTNEDWGFV